MLAVLPLILSAVVPVSLADALARAEAANPELLAARARAEAGQRRGEAAARQSWPRVTVGLDAFRTDNPVRVFGSNLNRGEFTEADFAIDRLNNPDALNHATTTATLEVPIDAFGKSRARTRAEQAVARALSARAAEAAQDVRTRVVEAWHAAAVAARARLVAASALEGARGREREIGDRVGQGQMLDADLLRVRARRRQREADLAAREADLAVARAALARAIGAPAGEEVEPAGEPAAAGDPGSLADWTARALATRPVLEGAQAAADAARWMAEGEVRGGRPDLGLFAQGMDDRGGFDGGGQSYAVGAQLRWTPGDPARSKRVAAARAERAAAEQDLRGATDQVRLEVEAAFRRAEAARSRQAAARGGAEEGREALRVIRERRQAGLATLTDELETEAASVAAELEELRAAAEAAVADAALRRAAGELQGR